jgi:thymidine kinase
MDDKSGYLHILMGPMYCGKTNALLNELLRFDVIGVPVLYLNSTIDTRADTPFSTHNPLVNSNSFLNITGKKVTDLFTLVDECEKYDVIGIDEAQFFKGLHSFVLEMVERRGKRVIVAGLSGNFRREPFGEVLSLVPYADRVDKLHALCTDCAAQRRVKDAHFSYRLEHSSTEEVMVGAASQYVPLCRSCYCRRNPFKENDG